jgi:hypothetical protein
MFELVVNRGYEKGQVFPLKEGDNAVGRAQTCAIQLKAGDVSRNHLMIRVSGSNVQAENISGRGACLLDGAPLQAPTPVQVGQQFTLGNSTVLLLRRVGEKPGVAPADGDMDELPTQPAAAGLVAPAVSAPASQPGVPPPPDPDPMENVTVQQADPPPVKSGPAAGVTQPIPELKKDESVVSDFLISRAPADEPDEDNGPVSGFVDFTATPEAAVGDSFDAQSMVRRPAGSILKRDAHFDPDSEPVSMLIDRDVHIPVVESPGNEDNEPRTRGLSREAMEYVRKMQLRKARIRLALIVGGCVILLILLAVLIINL